MRTTVTLVVALCILHPPVAIASVPVGTTSMMASPKAPSLLVSKRAIQDAIDRETARMSRQAPPSSAAGSVVQQQRADDRGWIRRHPAVFGALVGGVAGAASSAGQWTELYCAGGGDEDCLFHGGSGVLFGAGVGAGIGALVGWLVGR